MSKVMKRASFYAVIVLLVFALAACGGNTNATPTPTSGSNQTPDAVTEAPVVEASAPDADSEWNKILEAAKKETLNIVIQPGVQDQKGIDAFTAAYPDIKVEVLAARPSDVAPKIITEQQNNQFLWDLMIGATSNQTNVLGPAGAFQDIKPFLPEQSDEDWHGGFEMYSQNLNNDSWTFIILMDKYQTLHVNHKYVSKDDFSSLEDLLKPEFKGKVVWTTPNSQTGSSISAAGILKNKGEQFLTDLLTKQTPIFIDDKFQATNWLADGRYPIAFGADRPRIEELNAAGIGKDITLYRFEDSSATLSRGVSVLKNSPSPNATKVYLDWMLSKEGMTVYSEAFEMNVRRKDVPVIDPAGMIDWDKLDQYSLQGTEKGMEDILKVIEIYKANY